MNKMVVTLKHVCTHVKGQNEKQLNLYCRQHISSVSKTTEGYLQRMRVFEVTRTGESATISEIRSKTFQTSKRSRKSDEDIHFDQMETDDGRESEDEPSSVVDENEIF